MRDRTAIAWAAVMAGVGFGLLALTPQAEAIAWAAGFNSEASYGCPGIVLASGTVEAAEHELEDGAFSIGDATLIVHPKGIPFAQLLPLRHRAEAQEIVIRPAKCRPSVQRLDR